MAFYNRRIDLIEPPDNVRNSAFSQVRISRNSISIVVEWLGIGLFPGTCDRQDGKWPTRGGKDVGNDGSTQ